MTHLLVKVTPEGHSVLDQLIQAVVPDKLVLFLNQQIVATPFVWINYWSFVHFIAGMIGYKLLKGRIIWWVGISIAFEIAEFVLGGYTGSPLWVEEVIDTIWDLGFNIAGFYIAKKLWKK